MSQSGYTLLGSSSPSNGSVAAGLSAALFRGLSVPIQLVGDSTGVGTSNWFGKLGANLAAAYPAYNVWFRAWNAATQWYDLPTVIASGPSGDSRLAMSGSCAVRYVGTGITGDLDVRVRVAPTLWNKGAVQVLASRWFSTGNQRGWWFGLSTTGTPVMTWTTDGAAGTQVQVFATAGTSGLTNAAPYWLRVTLDVDNGASGNDVKFWTSPDGATWTQLGSTRTTAGVTSIFASTAPYQLGALDSSIGSTFAGDFYWVEIRDTVDGVSLVPPLVDTWDFATSPTVNTVVRAGSPTLLLVNGSETSQNIAYFDNATRRPRMLSPHNVRLVALSTNHNEGVPSDQAYITAYATWVANVKTLLPSVPIVTMAQNPQKSPRSAAEMSVHASRAAALMAWSAGQAGMAGVDTYRAFTDVASQVNSDGVHPSSVGSQAWADYVQRTLLPAG